MNNNKKMKKIFLLSMLFFGMFLCVPANATTYTVAGLSPLTVYKVYVEAYNSKGKSQSSREAGFKTDNGSEVVLPPVIVPPIDNGLILGTYKTDGSVREVLTSVDETKAFVVDYDKGLSVLDISDNSQIKLLSTLSLSGWSKALALSLDGNMLFVATGTVGLQIIDVSDALNPKIVGKYSSENISDVKLSNDGTKAFITDGFLGLLVIDVSDTSSPKYIASFACCSCC